MAAKTGGPALTNARTHARTLTGWHIGSGPGKPTALLQLGKEQRTCHPHHTSNRGTHTHTHTRIQHLDAVCACVFAKKSEACMFSSAQSTERSLPRADLGLFLARPPGLRHLQRDTESTMKTGSRFLDDRGGRGGEKKKGKKKRGRESWVWGVGSGGAACVWFCNRGDIRERPVL